MINRKKVFLIYTICFFLSITLILFPNYNSKIRLLSFYIKDKSELPFIHLTNELKIIFEKINLNEEYLKTIKNLEKQNNYLKSINNYLLTMTSKYSEQNRIFHNKSIEIPISIGVQIIGDRNLIYNKNFIIDKGINDGLMIGDYIIDGLNIVGRIVNLESNTSEVVTVKSINYGDEVFVNGKSYIVTGTNNDHLSFIRQKESTQIPDLKSGDLATVQLNNVILRLGTVYFENDQALLITNDFTNLENLRAITND